MLKLALSWFTGGGFKTIFDIYDRYKDSTDRKELAHAQWAKQQLDAMMENRRLTSGFIEMRVLTFFIAFPFVLHLNLVGLDTCFKLGWAISKYPPPFNEWEGTILLSFFGVAGGAIVVKTAASVLTSIFRR